MENYSTIFSYRQVNSKLIISDPAYQRPVDYNRVKSIVAHFNPDLVNPIKVSYRDGNYYVFDGQHTLKVLKARNNNRDLPVLCKVYSGLTQQDEARLFSEQNGLSRIVKANSKMKALFTAGDAEIIELHEAINSLGIKFDFSESKAAYKLICCATVRKIFDRVSYGDFQTILAIIRDSWQGDEESFNKEIVAGMYVFYTTYKSEIDINKAIIQFGKVSPRAIIRDGKAFKDGGDNRFARQLLLIYNKGLRTKKLKDILWEVQP